MSGEAPSEEPWRLFEREVRRSEEGEFAGDLLDADASLGLSISDQATFLAALDKCYPSGHWARAPETYQCAADAALQYLFARLVTSMPTVSSRLSSTCIRTIRSPRVSPYLSKYNVIVVPAGFLISISAFVRTIFAAAAFGAEIADPQKASALWEDERIILAQQVLVEKHASLYRNAVFKAVQPTACSLLLQPFGNDDLSAGFLTDDFQRGLAGMMVPEDKSMIESSLARHSPTQRMANAMVRLVVAFALSHELGHLLLVEGAESLGDDPERTDANSLARDEKMADTLALPIFHKLMNSGATDIFAGRPGSVADMLSATSAFHNWNLMVRLTDLMVADREDEQRCRALNLLHEVGARWMKAYNAFHDLDNGVATGSVGAGSYYITWSLPGAEMLRMLLHGRGHRCDMEHAIQLLSSLENRDSKLCALLRASPGS